VKMGWKQEGGVQVSLFSILFRSYANDILSIGCHQTHSSRRCGHELYATCKDIQRNRYPSRDIPPQYRSAT
jgi:hypothetical protein